MAKAYSLWIFDRQCNAIYHQDWSRIHHPMSNSNPNSSSNSNSNSNSGSNPSTSSGPTSFFQSSSRSSTTPAASLTYRRPGETLLPNVSRSVQDSALVNAEKTAPNSQAGQSQRNQSGSASGNGNQDDGLLPLDEEAKLVYGVVFSLRNMVTKLGGSHDHFNSYSTSNYTLSHLLTPTFHTFILFTDPISPPSRLPSSSMNGAGGIPGTAGMSLKGVLLQIWRGPWVENVVKNPLIRGLEREEYQDDEDEDDEVESEEEEEEEREEEPLNKKEKRENRSERKKEQRSSGIDSDALRSGIERVLNQNKLSAPSVTVG